jgi:RNA recognition motif-containing protein
MVNESNGRSKGYGIVEMATQQDALNAIQTLNNSELNGRSIFVREDQK